MENNEIKNSEEYKELEKKYRKLKKTNLFLTIYVLLTLIIMLYNTYM